MNIIRNNIYDFMNARDYNSRNASYDYCYNYFRGFYTFRDIDNMSNKGLLDISCMQIMNFLASWGMLRGGCYLFNKSVYYYKSLIINISKLDKSYFEIDVNNYDKNMGKIFDIIELIKQSFKEFEPTDTLITKIMLVIFGCIPAFDRYFKLGMGITSLNKESLRKIYTHYMDNKNTYDNIKINTLSFNNDDSDYEYTNAKKIDMVMFMKGLRG